MLRNDDLARLLLRLSVGILMLFHGVHKLLHGISHIQGMMQAHGLPGWLGYGVFVGEVVAPVMIILGFYARIGAALMAVNMMVAVALLGGLFPLQLTKTGGPVSEMALLYLFAALALFFSGPGRYSINRS
ncbi:DoxX family protein [Sulfurimonas sp. HSL1-2]|uniref:DoxX family protein n=1 Tax=Thiomicrolovo zhangzhouensis TaxID=3131933 RepID=UPI0031FA0057